MIFEPKTNKVAFKTINYFDSIKQLYSNYKINDMLYLKNKGTLIFNDTEQMKIFKLDSNYHVKEIATNMKISSSKGKIFKSSLNDKCLLISTNMNKTVELFPDFLDQPESCISISIENNQTI